MTKICLNLNLEKSPTAVIDPRNSPRKTRDKRVPNYVSVSFKLFLMFGEELGKAPWSKLVHMLIQNKRPKAHLLILGK